VRKEKLPFFTAPSRTVPGRLAPAIRGPLPPRRPATRSSRKVLTLLGISSAVARTGQWDKTGLATTNRTSRPSDNHRFGKV